MQSNARKVSVSPQLKLKIQAYENADLFKDIQILCPQKRKGLFYCTQCNQNAVICNCQECKCYEIHSNCESFQKISTFNLKLNSLIIKKERIQQIQKTIKKMTTQISKFEAIIKNQFKYFGLSLAEEKIAKSILSLKQGKILKGQDFKEYKKQQPFEERWFKQSIERFEVLVSISKVYMGQLYDQISKIISLQHKKHQRRLSFPEKESVKQAASSRICIKSPSISKSLSKQKNDQKRTKQQFITSPTIRKGRQNKSSIKLPQPINIERKKRSFEQKQTRLNLIKCLSSENVGSSPRLRTGENNFYCHSLNFYHDKKSGLQAKFRLEKSNLRRQAHSKQQ